MTPIEPTDSELLTSYAVDGSEAAFGQLVRRHLGLVYSAALRQLGGGSASAEDVVQLVFTVLAREADGLRRRESIAGWLHTTTRHLSAKARRSDERRLLRETTALTMNPTDDTAAWEEMSPILDTALHELPDNDREAVLLRFFEKLSLGEVGSRLGVGEDAARKRVDRALDKLRGLLAKRGVTSTTAAALAALLLDRASAAPPIQLAAEATATALKAAATVASGGLLAWFLGWPAKVALVAGIVAVVASVAIQSHHSGKSADRWQSAALDGFQAASSASRGITPSIPSNGDTASAPAFTEPDGQQKMLFQVISKTSGQPLPHATVFVEHTSENGTYASKTLHTDTNGYCKIFYPFGTATLLVSGRTDGWGDRTVGWRIAEKAFPPPDYVLQVDSAVPIGGIVVDESGRPIKGVKVRAGSKVLVDSVSSRIAEPFETELLSMVNTTTDESGRWSVSRLAEAVVGKSGMIVFLNTDHPAFQEWSTDNRSGSNVSQAALRAGNARIVLHRTLSITGLVVGPDGEPVANAVVSLGYISLAGSKTGIRTLKDGTFSIGGCEAGRFPVSAIAKGFAVTTKEIDIGTDTPPVHLELGVGRTVHFRVMDTESNSIPNARVMYDPIPRDDLPRPLPQDQFLATTDNNGSVVWSNAPLVDLPIITTCPGYDRSDALLKAQATEIDIVLQPDTKRVISGRVTDASTGERVPRIRLVTGSATTVRGCSNAIFNGQIHEVIPKVFDFGAFTQKVPTNSAVMLKVEADGYLPFYSRVLPPEEGDVDLSIALKPSRLNRIPVRSPSGNAVPGITIWLHRLNGGSRTAMITPDGPNPAVHVPETVKALPTEVSDARGTIARDWDADAAVVQILASCAQGYAFTTPEDVDRSGEVRLKPWGRIEGMLPTTEQGWRVITSYNDPVSAERPYGLSFQVPSTPCNEGRFVLPKLPAGSCELFFSRAIVADKGTTNWVSGGQLTVQVESAATSEVMVKELPIPASH